MHSRRAHLTLHQGALVEGLPTAEQLRLGDNTNHPVVQARMRDVLALVQEGTYRGRDGRPHPFQARHHVIMTHLCLAVNKYGEVHPGVLTLAALAAHLGRDRHNVNRDARELEAALLFWRRPVVDTMGRRFVYVIPGMAAPLDDRGRPQRPGR